VLFPQLCAAGKAGQAHQRWAGRTGGHKDNKSVRTLSLAGSGFLLNLILRGRNCKNSTPRKARRRGNPGFLKFGVIFRHQ